MSRLLLDDEPLVVLPKLATVIGLNEAIILQQLHYWLEKSNNVKDGFRWIYNTYEEWKNQFPFWSESTIKRTLRKLQERKIIIVGNYNKMKIDHTKWYRIDYERLENIEQDSASQIEQTSSQNDQTKMSNCPDEQVKMTRPIPETTTEITTENVSSSNSAFSFYENNFGVLNAFMADSIDHWIGDTSEELVIASMERALKRQAKWNYAEGILKQWTNKNIRTLSDVKASEEAFKRQQQSKKRVQGGSSYGSSKRSDDEDFEYIGL
ncbi:DnaD and phage-associated domain-containing protein [Bacillus cereus VD133]|uniref:DnaD and phage-associated domain-containing protein n=1 Tax=Bacillus cereus VD133 TaxID=1053233 RepID=A0A9W5PLP6_BACCE|nr:DnaD domain protein [Bacillus cereus]EOO28916.1 DnaD and phage-associated domain-containing protein [Bacillus cereus VD133]